MFKAVPGQRQVVFSWSTPPLTPVTSYTLSCSPSPSSLPQSPSQAGHLTVAGFSPDSSYSCSVVATNSQGSGPPSHTNFTTLQDCKSLFCGSTIHSHPCFFSIPCTDSYFQLCLSGAVACSELIVSVFPITAICMQYSTYIIRLHQQKRS